MVLQGRDGPRERHDQPVRADQDARQVLSRGSDDEAELSDGVVRLRAWTAADAGWYAHESGDEQIQRFTTDPPGLTAADVVRAIENLDPVRARAFLVTDGASGDRLGNLAVDLEGGVGHVSYWVAAGARGRGVAAAAVRLVGDWLLDTGQVTELRLHTHEANTASQRAALKAGFVRDPDRDGVRQVKGETWPIVAYRLA